MKTQLVAAAAIFAVIASVVFWLNSALDGAELRGHERGIVEERLRWQQRESQELAARNARILELEQKYRELEQHSVQVAAAAAAAYEKELKNVRAQKDRVIADLRRGAERLRIPVVTPTCEGGGGSAAPETRAGTPERDGASRAELSEEAARFLTELAAEADEVVLQLKACQAILRADRGEG